MLIKNNSARVHQIASIRLLPGVNEVSPEAWDLHKTKPVVTFYLDSRELEVKATSPFDQMQVLDQVAVIKETLDIRLLNRWADQAKSSKLQRAIENQIKYIEKETTVSS